MNISLENLLVGMGALIVSLLSYLISKTFKDLIKSIEYNSLILAKIQTEIAVFTERFNNSSHNLDKLGITVKDYNDKYRVKFDKLEKLETEFQECRKQCQRCGDKKA